MKLADKLTIALAATAVTALAGLGALPLGGADDAPAPIVAAGKTDRLPAIDPVVTAAIPDPQIVATSADTARLGAALTAIGEGRLDEARRLRDRLAPGSVDRDLVDWTIAMSGHPQVGAGEIARTMRQLADWPGQDALARNHERALTRGWLGNAKLRTMFTGAPPTTFEAAYALAKSHLASGEHDQARALFAPHWRTAVLPASIEREALDRFDGVLTADDHRARYFNMMVRERVRSAARIAEAAGMADLHPAWAAVIAGSTEADRRLAEVPDALLESEAGLYARIEHLRRTERFEAAADLLAEVPADPAALTNPDAWWNERRIVSRSLREAGQTERAFAIVDRHRGGEPATEVDAAFHAGWYALRDLGDPARARPHFERIEAIAVGPSSRARAAYWLGRTAIAAGDADAAEAHFRRAASYPTAFYGQLAAQRLGMQRLPVPAKPVPASVQRELGGTRVLAAIERQLAVGETRFLSTLYRGLAERFDTADHYVMLAGHAAAAGHHTLGLRLAKAGQWRGHDLGIATHPVGAIPSGGPISAADRALAYAIARQESEFNTEAISGADARGLLQLLPSTARELAGRMDLAYSPARLTADPAFNALLGTQYLDEQRGRFGGSYVLTFIAYNAGPGRARQWIERFGDPRGLSLEATIDWIEQIPYPETRQYVQKVMENLTVYKARFGLPLTIEQDLTLQPG